MGILLIYAITKLYLLFTYSLQLFAGHFIGEFVLQSKAVRRNKNPLTTANISATYPWYYWMLANAVLSGAIVGMIFQNYIFGILEALLHYIIDLLRCYGAISVRTEQLLYLFTKVLYAIIFVLFFIG